MLGGRSSMWNKLIRGIHVRDEDLFVNTLFQAISKHPSYVILSDMESQRKSTIIAAMISYYENREDYEKCAILFEIQKDLNTVC